MNFGKEGKILIKTDELKGYDAKRKFFKSSHTRDGSYMVSTICSNNFENPVYLNWRDWSTL